MQLGDGDFTGAGIQRHDPTAPGNNDGTFGRSSAYFVGKKEILRGSRMHAGTPSIG